MTFEWEITLSWGIHVKEKKIRSINRWYSFAVEQSKEVTFKLSFAMKRCGVNNMLIP